MEQMVRPARPASWNRRNRLMNRQGTIWNRPEPEPFATGSKWNRNRNGTGPTQTVAMPTSRHRLHTRVNLKMDLSSIRDRPHQRLSTIELLSNPTNYYIYIQVINKHLQSNSLFTW